MTTTVTLMSLSNRKAKKKSNRFAKRWKVARLRRLAMTAKKSRTRQVVELFKKNYPDAHCALNYQNPLQLLMATILSAQCTDVRVNLVTPELFKKYPGTKAFADAKLSDLEKMIRSTGFYKNKAKNIKKCA